MDESHTVAHPVVADTSPIIALAAVYSLHLLPALYRELVIPTVVHHEYEAGRRPQEPTLDRLPWLSIMDVTLDGTLPAALDPGESAAITLAMQTRARAIILDEKLGRRAAMALGLPVVGTLGILVRAKREGHIHTVQPVIDRMITHGIRIGPALRRETLQLVDEA